MIYFVELLAFIDNSRTDAGNAKLTTSLFEGNCCPRIPFFFYLVVVCACSRIIKNNRVAVTLDVGN